MIAEALASEVRLGQPKALDLGAGSAVEDQDPLRQKRPQQGESFLSRADRAGWGRALRS